MLARIRARGIRLRIVGEICIQGRLVHHFKLQRLVRSFGLMKGRYIKSLHVTADGHGFALLTLRSCVVQCPASILDTNEYIP